MFSVVLARKSVIQSSHFWEKELHKSMDRCTGSSDWTEIMFKTSINQVTNQSINQIFSDKLNLH